MSVLSKIPSPFASTIRVAVPSMVGVVLPRELKNAVFLSVELPEVELLEPVVPLTDVVLVDKPVDKLVVGVWAGVLDESPPPPPPHPVESKVKLSKMVLATIECLYPMPIL